MGEVEPKERYFWGTYKYGTKDNLTKYNGSDNKITIDPEDDAVVERYFCKRVIARIGLGLLYVVFHA